MNMRKLKKGFTLIEIMIVVAVIAIISSYFLGKFAGQTDQANTAIRMMDARQLNTAVAMLTNPGGQTLTGTTTEAVLEWIATHNSWTDPNTNKTQSVDVSGIDTAAERTALAKRVSWVAASGNFVNVAVP